MTEETNLENAVVPNTAVIDPISERVAVVVPGARKAADAAWAIRVKVAPGWGRTVVAPGPRQAPNPGGSPVCWLPRRSLWSLSRLWVLSGMC